jgi:UDP-N-acetylmuramate--alanine ligase
MQPEIKQHLEHLLTSGPERIHLIGVCGSGMSGLARLLLAQGHNLSGSDLIPAAEASDYVPAGVRYCEGHAAANIDGAALIVFSSAIAVENPERVAAVEKGMLSVRRAECLVVLADAKDAYVIARRPPRRC